MNLLIKQTPSKLVRIDMYYIYRHIYKTATRFAIIIIASSGKSQH